MRIDVLIENTAIGPEFHAEHGLSLYIEANGRKILFDTGATGAFADNAKRMGVNLQEVDFAVLSHGHYDHGGGLWRFFEENDHAPVYVNRHVFGAYYNRKDRYIGLDPALEQNGRLRMVEDALNIAEGITIRSFSHAPLKYPLDSAGLTQMKDGQKIPDTFTHEQILLIEENGKRIVISGCSHRGILNIVDWTEPDVLVGGFHFMKKEITEGSCPDLDEAARVLLSHKTRYYTGHCTGLVQYEYLKERMGDALSALSSGLHITI